MKNYYAKGWSHGILCHSTVARSKLSADTGNTCKNRYLYEFIDFRFCSFVHKFTFAGDLDLIL